jgi:hypothetical protein
MNYFFEFVVASLLAIALLWVSLIQVEKLDKYQSTLRSLNTPVNITEDKETSIFIFTDEKGNATYLKQ